MYRGARIAAREKKACRYSPLIRRAWFSPERNTTLPVSTHTHLYRRPRPSLASDARRQLHVCREHRLRPADHALDPPHDRPLLRLVLGPAQPHVDVASRGVWGHWHLQKGVVACGQAAGRFRWTWGGGRGAYSVRESSTHEAPKSPNLYHLTVLTSTTSLCFMFHRHHRASPIPDGDERQQITRACGQRHDMFVHRVSVKNHDRADLAWRT